MRITLLVALLASTCTPVPQKPPPVLDGGSLHSYVCPVGDGGAAWTCQDGLTVPVGACAAAGCVPQ